MNTYTFSNSTKQLKSRSSSYIWAHLIDVGAFIVVARGVRAGIIGWNLLHAYHRRQRSQQTCWRGGVIRRRGGGECGEPPTSPPRVVRWKLLLVRERRSGAAAARTSHLLHTRGRRSDVAAAGASHLLAWGRRRSAARGRSEPPVALSGLPLHELRMLANHSWPNIEKIAT
jgi:hypothetical protein